MEHSSISHLLIRVRRLQLFATMTECCLLILSAVIAWKATAIIGERYLIDGRIILIVLAAAFAVFLAKSTVRYFSRNDLMNAMEIDRRFELKNRITTYVELRGSNHPFLSAIEKESAPKVSAIRASEAVRIRSEISPALLLLALITATWVIVPYLPVPESISARAEEQKQIAESARKMEKTLQKLIAENKHKPEIKKLLQEFQKVSQDLQRPDIRKPEALKKLNALQDKLKKMEEIEKRSALGELAKARDNAGKGQTGKENLTQEQQKEMQKLAKELDSVLKGQEPGKGRELQNMKMEQFSGKDMESMKKALEQYRQQTAQSEQMRSELRKSLETAQKGTSSGKGRYTKDSRIKDRDMEKGKGGVEDGPGTTNQDTGPSTFDTKKKGQGKYVEDRTKAEYERLFQGERQNAGKDPLFLENRWNQEGDPQFTNVRSFGVDKDAALTGSSGDSASQSQDESAVEKEKVPASYQKIVKEYFESIESD